MNDSELPECTYSRAISEQCSTMPYQAAEFLSLCTTGLGRVGGGRRGHEDELSKQPHTSPSHVSHHARPRGVLVCHSSCTVLLYCPCAALVRLVCGLHGVLVRCSFGVLVRGSVFNSCRRLQTTAHCCCLLTFTSMVFSSRSQSVQCSTHKHNALVLAWLLAIQFRLNTQRPNHADGVYVYQIFPCYSMSLSALVSCIYE